MHPFIHIPSRQVGYRPLPSQRFICVPSKPSFPFCFPMAHTVESFIYSPLALGKHEIRLLRLQPRHFSSSDEIECELLQVNLDTKPYYEALSYEWGPPANSPFWISIDGKLHQVRENLSDALRDLRLKYEPRMLWIDALCINQDDPIELAHEVKRMKQIYRGTSQSLHSWDPRLKARLLHFNSSRMCQLKRGNEPMMELKIDFLHSGIPFGKTNINIRLANGKHLVLFSSYPTGADSGYSKSSQWRILRPLLLGEMSNSSGAIFVWPIKAFGHWQTRLH